MLVATPVGNLGDLSPRARAALAGAALICCEDTRRTGRLLAHAGITGVRLAVCNEHTERARVPEVLEALGAGGDVAVVTDAGTPGISDPGERLTAAVLDAGYEVTTVPGPAAFVAGLVVSGLPTGRFVFEGFLPRSGRARSERLAELAKEPRTIVLYEAPHRIERTMADLAEALGPERRVTVARELTKLYETVVHGTLGDVELGAPRGEYVLVVAGAPADDRGADGRRRASRAPRGAGGRRVATDAAAAVARRLGVPRRVAYDLAAAEPGRGPGGYRDGRPEPGVALPRDERHGEQPTASTTSSCTSRRVRPAGRPDAYRGMVGSGPERGVLRPRPHADRRLVGVHHGARRARPASCRRASSSATPARRCAFKLTGSSDRTTDGVRDRILGAVRGLRQDDLVALNAEVLPKLLAKSAPRPAACSTCTATPGATPTSCRPRRSRSSSRWPARSA